jgi:FkbM family methyltransferase
MNIRRFLQKTLAKPIFKFSFEEYEHSSNYFSQNGEDIILLSLFKEPGFYVDVGAHDPIIKSNTFLLQQKGWSGINIDPNESTINRFNAKRPSDQNIRALISNESSSYEYLHYNEPAVNCISSERRSEIDKKYKLLKTEKVKSRRLSDVLNSANIPESGIDVLDVDCEGHDLSVLQSNDWGKFRPKVILAEENEENENSIHTYLENLHFSLILKINNTLVFRKK